MSERPTKRFRGSYAKHICLRCRERRIKCQIPDDAEVDLSGKPQPPEKACERCRQRGLDCIVRKTTLGRPAQKSKAAPSRLTVADPVADEDSGHSPEPSDLVLLGLDHEDRPAPSLRNHASETNATNVQLIRSISNNFNFTSALLARDPRFGSAIVQSAAEPRTLESMIDQHLAQVLDQHLVWLRLYLPWLPRLNVLIKDLQDGKLEMFPSSRLLIALLALIALETPSKQITAEQREYRTDLQTIIKRTGQEVLFTLPRHRHTVDALLLVHAYRPLSLIDTHQAAAHTLNGTLYLTLVNAVQQQLGMDRAAFRLRDFLDGRGADANTHQLITDTIQWCLTKSLQLDDDLYRGDVSKFRDDLSEREIEQALNVVSSAIEHGHANISHLFIYSWVRWQTDSGLTFRKLTKSWSNLTLLSSVIKDYEELGNRRKASLELTLNNLFCAQGKTDEALAILQILSMEINHDRTNILGTALFFAIVSVAQESLRANPRGEVIELAKYYSGAVHDLEQFSSESAVLNDVREFLDKYGDMHMDGLEKELSDFIILATELQLNGIPFSGPPRHTTSRVLLTCKEIVEHNAVRVRLDGELHPRIDLQLILFQECARRLESMEIDGGSAEAVARGSIFTATAKLIRSLHRIVSKWKRTQMTKPPTVSSGNSTTPTAHTQTPVKSEFIQPVANDPFMEPSGLFPDDFFADWDNWPQLNPAELAYSFPFDYDLGQT